MSSPTNRKPGTPPEAPQEPFKRAVASCMRAMSRTPTLEVVYAADRPMVSGHGEGAKARLPEPPRKLSPREAAIVRGHADSMALKLACHDAGVHRRFSPEAQAARAVFDAVEQVRVESIGARRMDGVAINLGAMLEDRYHRGNYADITDRADAPLEDAVALIARERLTGRAPPQAAQKIVDLWRAVDREPRGRRSRHPRPRDRGPAGLRPRRPQAARLPRHGRSLRLRARGERRRGQERRAAGHAREPGRRRRGVRIRRDHGFRHGRIGRGRHGRGNDGERRRSHRRGARRFGRRRQRRSRRIARATFGHARTARPPPTSLTSPSSTRSSPPRTFANRRSWSGSGPISTSSSAACRASSRASPTGCSAA